MQRHATMTAVAAALTLAFSAPAQAQGASFFLGGGPTFPAGDFKDAVQTGWMGTTGVLFGLANGVFIFAEFLYGENTAEATTGKSKLAGGMANIGYRFGSATSPGLYVYGGAGGLNTKFSGLTTLPTVNLSQTDFAYGGAAGLDIPLGGVTLWIEARYIAAKDTRFVPLMAGLSIGG